MDAFHSRPFTEAMKPPIAPTLLLALLALALPSASQNVPQPGRQQPQQPIYQPGQPGQPGQPPHNPAAAELPFNVRLKLDGSFFGVSPTDFSVTTGGPTVLSDMPLKLDDPTPVIGTFQATLTPGEPWTASISLGVQVPIATGNGKVEYRDFVLRTTVRISPGKKVVLWEKGEHKLTLGLEEVKE